MIRHATVLVAPPDLDPDRLELGLIDALGTVPLRWAVVAASLETLTLEAAYLA